MLKAHGQKVTKSKGLKVLKVRDRIPKVPNDLNGPNDPNDLNGPNELA